MFVGSTAKHGQSFSEHNQIAYPVFRQFEPLTGLRARQNGFDTLDPGEKVISTMFSTPCSTRFTSSAFSAEKQIPFN